MKYYHGSCLVDLEVGQALLPVRQSGRHANPRVNVDLVELYDDGVTRHDHDVIWLEASDQEAAGWAYKPMLKCTGEDVKAMQEERGKPVACIVYEVEPVGPVFRRATPHSEGEYGCSAAIVVAREVVEVYDWHEFQCERGPNGEWIDSYTGEVVP